MASWEVQNRDELELLTSDRPAQSVFVIELDGWTDIISPHTAEDVNRKYEIAVDHFSANDPFTACLR